MLKETDKPRDKRKVLRGGSWKKMLVTCYVQDPEPTNTRIPRNLHWLPLCDRFAACSEKGKKVNSFQN